jgi:hypothetical protein
MVKGFIAKLCLGWEKKRRQVLAQEIIHVFEIWPRDIVKFLTVPLHRIVIEEEYPIAILVEGALAKHAVVKL